MGTIEVFSSEEIYLDDQIRISQPETKLVVEIKSSFFINGNNIKRYLVTNPISLEINQISPAKIEIKPVAMGSTFLHIWDDNGRWTFNVKVIAPKSLRMAVQEALKRQRVGEPESFKVNYDIQRFAGFTGGKTTQMRRNSLVYTHNLKATGETPYGFVDTAARFLKDEELTDNTYLTAGLTNADVSFVKDFDLRFFDFKNNFGPLILPAIMYRGVNFTQRILDEKVAYTTFWGRESQYGFSSISAGSNSKLDSYASGGSVIIRPIEASTFQLTGAGGYGEDRPEYLPKQAYDIQGTHTFGDVTIEHDLAYDTRYLAGTAGFKYKKDQFRLESEYRNIPKDFTNIAVRPSGFGELGFLSNVAYYTKDNKFSVSSYLDIYRDRTFPNLAHPRRFNLSSNTQATFQLAEGTNLRGNWDYFSREGTSFPSRTTSYGLYLSQLVKWYRPINVFVNYQRRKNRNFTDPSGDYDNNRISFGLRSDLTENLSCFALEEINLLKDSNFASKTYPTAFETGISYRKDFFNDFHTEMAVTYRTENDTKSLNSFMIGEDSLTASGEIAYRPAGNFEIFSRMFVRVSKSEVEPETEGRIEFQHWLGGRYLFDTTLSWSPTTNISGYVFKDVNGDGIWDDEEEGISGVKVYIEEREETTDERGHYEFKSVSGKSAHVSIDPGTLPPGFVSTDAMSKIVKIKQGQKQLANFGVATRSEICGTVFVDVDGNGKLDRDEKVISDVRLTLDGKKTQKTRSAGRYFFRGVVSGHHQIKLDLNTVPIEYMPKVSLTKDLELFEGVTYVYNIPLREIKKSSKIKGQ